MAKQVKKGRSKRLNAAEAVYAFCGWLTTRQNPVTMSSTHNASVPCELVKGFVEANDLPKVRSNYHNLIVPVEGMDDVQTPPVPQANVVKTWSPHEVIQVINDLLGTQNARNQNQVLAKVLNRLKVERTNRFEHTQRQNINAKVDENEAYESLNEFNNILNGSFTVVS